VRKVVVGLLGAALVTSVGVMLPTTANAAPPVDPAPAAKAHKSAAPVDDLPNPLEDKRRALREQAVADVVSGKAKPKTVNGSTVLKVGKTQGSGVSDRAVAATGADQFVELSRERTDRIFVILAQFGNDRAPGFPDVDSDPNTPGPSTFDGPVHNAIPEPNRAVDNTTVWQADYNPQHYRDLYFNPDGDSLKTYFQDQSSGRYSVDGEVTDWVKVKYNEARYGRDVCGSHVCNNTWALVRDAANQWVADQKAAGRTDAQIATDMKSFDQYDRYDYDHDGNFNEPDGYIDHFQIVHAGGDQADGDPQQGEDAIWSHRWYAYGTDAGRTGPSGNLLGGTQIGTSGLWIGDYTIQPENGGLSVFTHEYTHDLGLPDDYDTTGAGDNANEYWTLMAQSRLNGAGEALGTKPGDMGAWNKLQLGWLDYETFVPSQKNETITLGPEEFNTDNAQAMLVVLPDKKVTTDLGAPFAGAKQFYSGNADNLDNTLSKDIDLTGKTTASVTLQGRYNIEQDYDYLYFEASTDGGKTWTRLDGTVGGAPFPKDASNTPALTGSTANLWKPISVPLNAYAGKAIKFRLHYLTDGGVSAGGFFGDDLTVTADGAVVSADGAEAASTWALAGFSAVGSSTTTAYVNFFIAGNRTYVSHDQYLKTGPYNFGFLPDKQDFVEHYAYQTGLLVSYWDTSQRDNNVSVHPGQGLNLYIDSRPKPLYNIEGLPWRTRIQIYDAPFSLSKAASFTLHVGGKASNVRGQNANPIFNDKDEYFDSVVPSHGVHLPGAGVKLEVLSQSGTSMDVKFN
jgi:immune inhibitor A